MSFSTALKTCPCFFKIFLVQVPNEKTWTVLFFFYFDFQNARITTYANTKRSNFSFPRDQYLHSSFSQLQKGVLNLPMMSTISWSSVERIFELYNMQKWLAFFNGFFSSSNVIFCSGEFSNFKKTKMILEICLTYFQRCSFISIEFCFL